MTALFLGNNLTGVKRIVCFFLLFSLFAACRSVPGSAGASSGKPGLIAAGATFPLPFYNMAFRHYTRETGVSVTYGGIGSGGGIRSLKDRIVDFGGTDAFLSDKQLQAMPAPVVHVPTCIGAVVIAYNLPGVDTLKLSGELLERIFMGQITRWNDPALIADNPGVGLPDEGIIVVTRSDGSGTTQIFSDYMSKISSKWAEEVGAGKALKWPTGMAAKGNPGVAGIIVRTFGSIGYVSSEYALAQKIQTAQIRNGAGRYIAPGIASISAAAKGDIPDDTRIMLTDSRDPDAYPISGFTWLVLYREQAYQNRSREQAKETVRLLHWLTGEQAQGDAARVHYAPLPLAAADKARAALASITWQGERLLPSFSDELSGAGQ